MYYTVCVYITVMPIPLVCQAAPVCMCKQESLECRGRDKTGEHYSRGENREKDKGIKRAEMEDHNSSS